MPPLYRLARELRYRALPELVGRTIELGSLEVVESELRGLVAPWLPAGARWSGNVHLAGALAKYGLIDTSFAAPPALLDHPSTEVGAPVLRATGFVPQRGERWELTPEEAADPMFADPTCLGSLAEDLEEPTCELKLFLQDDLPQAVHAAHLMEAVKTRPVQLTLPAGYFPRRLTVEDACITNAPFVWFHKHFYL